MKIKHSGFTLVEILVVVTIISMLASIAAVSYSRFVKQSRDARRKTDIEQIRAAVEMYRNFNGEYPSTVTSGASITDSAPSTTIYMTRVPSDPMPAYAYYYLRSSTQNYSLCAYIEGGNATSISASCGTLNCNYCMSPYGEL